jgi:hypothetical protein
VVSSMTLKCCCSFDNYRLSRQFPTMPQSLLVLRCDWLEKQQKIAAPNSMHKK